MNNQMDYWLDLCEYDLDTAKAMLETKRFLYVGFMCHQVIEKALKAVCAQNTDAVPPKIHNLSRLAQKSNLFSIMNQQQQQLLGRLMPLNIEGRYPSDKAELLKELTQEECQKLIKDTEELVQWILHQLKTQ